MTRITLNAPLIEELKAIRERVEVCDDEGHRIGFFDPDRSASSYPDPRIPFTEEELRLAEQETGGRPLSEILTDLERRSCD